MAKAAFDPAAGSWEPFRDTGFVELVGPVWFRRETADTVYAFQAEPKHANLVEVVQGGMLMTFADRALGAAAWASAGDRPCVTVQFNMHFISSAQIGDFVEARPEVVRRTASLIFMRGMLSAGERVVASCDGVWKILAPR